MLTKRWDPSVPIFSQRRGGGLRTLQNLAYTKPLPLSSTSPSCLYMDYQFSYEASMVLTCWEYVASKGKTRPSKYLEKRRERYDLQNP